MSRSMRIKAIYPGLEARVPSGPAFAQSLSHHFNPVLALLHLGPAWISSQPQPSAASPSPPGPSLKAGWKGAGSGGGLQLRPAR